MPKFIRLRTQTAAWLGMRFAQVKEEPAKRAGDMEQNAYPATRSARDLARCKNQGLKNGHV